MLKTCFPSYIYIYMISLAGRSLTAWRCSQVLEPWVNAWHWLATTRLAWMYVCGNLGWTSVSLRGWEKHAGATLWIYTRLQDLRVWANMLNFIFGMAPSRHRETPQMYFAHRPQHFPHVPGYYWLQSWIPKTELLWRLGWSAVHSLASPGGRPFGIIFCQRAMGHPNRWPPATSLLPGS